MVYFAYKSYLGRGPERLTLQRMPGSKASRTKR